MALQKYYRDRLIQSLEDKGEEVDLDKFLIALTRNMLIT
jgi:hypothetical protein